MLSTVEVALLNQIADYRVAVAHASSAATRARIAVKKRKLAGLRAVIADMEKARLALVVRAF